MGVVDESKGGIKKASGVEMEKTEQIVTGFTF